MTNMIKVKVGDIFDIGLCKVKAVKEKERHCCTGCFFNKVDSFYRCSKFFLNCPASKLIFIKYEDRN